MSVEQKKISILALRGAETAAKRSSRVLATAASTCLIPCRHCQVICVQSSRASDVISWCVDAFSRVQTFATIDKLEFAVCNGSGMCVGGTSSRMRLGKEFTVADQGVRSHPRVWTIIRGSS